jgi:hypothetical protein
VASNHSPSVLRLLVTPRMWRAGVMGFSSGLPILLSITVLQAWLIAEEIDLTTIGFLGLVALPYNLKFYLGSRCRSFRSFAAWPSKKLARDLTGLHCDQPSHPWDS